MVSSDDRLHSIRTSVQNRRSLIGIDSENSGRYMNFVPGSVFTHSTSVITPVFLIYFRIVYDTRISFLAKSIEKTMWVVQKKSVGLLISMKILQRCVTNITGAEILPNCTIEGKSVYYDGWPIWNKFRWFVRGSVKIGKHRVKTPQKCWHSLRVRCSEPVLARDFHGSVA